MSVSGGGRHHFSTGSVDAMVLLLVVTSATLAVAAANVFNSSGPPSGPSFFYGGRGFGGDFCGVGLVRHIHGSCITPQVTPIQYLYRAPDVATIVGPRPIVAPPQIEHNIIFIHTPEDLINQQPVVVPPPQQKNVVYVLNKRPQQDQAVIHVPAPKQEAPEVFFVNYAEGENPSLPTGGDLRSALSKASQRSGEVVNGDDTVDGIYTDPSLPQVVPARRVLRKVLRRRLVIPGRSAATVDKLPSYSN